jgi:hypothetical protein
MSTSHIEIENPAEDRVTLHLVGPQFRNVNDKLLQSCFSALLECADENQCFERGLNVACLGTIAKHNAKTQCCGEAFGVGASAVATG